MATLYALAGVIGGIAIAGHARTTERVLSDETTHPFVAHGIGLAAFVLTTWTVTMAVLSFMAWRIHDAGGVGDAGAYRPT